MTTLTAPEQGDLKRLEKVIESGLVTFIEVGLALAEISERKLYRIKYQTFDDYVSERWHISDTHAYRLIAGARVVEDIRNSPTSPLGGIEPQTERQTRPLQSPEFTPEMRAEIWAEALHANGGKPPTEEVVERIAARALAGLTAEEQREVIEAEEREVAARAQDRTELEEAGRYMETISAGRKLLDRLGKVLDKLGVKSRVQRSLECIERAIDLHEVR